MSDAIQRLRDHRADIAIVLGSGLNSLVADPAKDQTIPYSEFSDVPQPSVPGHAGRFVLGKIGKARVIFAQGRVHLYEGLSARDVTACVRILAEAGIKQLILTNAAGSANPKFKPGSWMMITDHINLTGTSPLARRPQFIDLTEAYSSRLRENFRRSRAQDRHRPARRRLRRRARPAVRNAGRSAHAAKTRRRRRRHVHRARSDPGRALARSRRLLLPNKLRRGISPGNSVTRSA